MKTFITKQTITLPAGTLVGLSPEQSKARAPYLQPQTKKGNFVLKEAQSFKRGETLGIDGELTKAQADLVITPEDARAQREAAEAAAAAREAAALAAAYPIVLADLLAKLKPETAAAVRAELADANKPK